MNFKQYPEYKKSEIEWIDEIPSYWDNEKAKYLFKEISIKGFPEKTLLSVSKGKGLLPRDQLEFRTVMAIKDLHNFKLVQENQFVIHLRSFQSGFELSKIEGIVSPAYTVFEALNQEVTGYFKYVFYSKLFIDYIASTTMSLRDGKPVSYQNFSSMLVPLPPLEEQAIITDFLDKELLRIDQTLEKYEKLIELLKEKRISLISQVITKGLNKNVEMKSSGVQWIGEIPAHWEIVKLKYFCKINPPKSVLDLNKWDEVSFLPMENVSEEGNVDLGLIKKLYLVNRGFTYFKDNDVILAKITPCFENGKGAVLSKLMNGVGFGSTEFHVLRPLHKISDSEFLFYITKTHLFRNIGKKFMRGVAGQQRITTDFVKDFFIGKPPIEEQKLISQYLNRELLMIDMVIEKISKQITLIKEYKISLISSLVTGKIDVREKSSK